MGKILHISSGLKQGGTERFLHNLLSFTDHKKHQHIVVSLTGSGHYEALLQEIGIEVLLYDLKKHDNLFSIVFALRKLVKENNITTIQGWMYHGNLIASLVGFGKTKVLWGIRQSLNTTGLGAFTKALIYILGFLSWQPNVIIYNSTRSAKEHQSLLYSNKKSIIIPNGFNSHIFRHMPDAYHGLRKEINVDTDTKLIGIVARFHPMKGHLNFLRAAQIFSKFHPEINFILVGSGMVKNQEFKLLIENLGLQGRVHLLGARSDIPWINSALDIATLASCTEAFPNVLAEYMLCEVPCVTTDVGDAGLILNGFGKLVPPEDPDALSQAWNGILRLSKEQLMEQVKKGRESIIDHYSIGHIIQQYEGLYSQYDYN